ncbi:MAG: hypothetical protein AB8B91_19560, partial [Rubripirellula sp.]
QDPDDVGTPIPVEPDGGIGDGAGAIPELADGPTTDVDANDIPMEQDPDDVGTPIPVEPDGGIGDGAGPIPDLDGPTTDGGTLDHHPDTIQGGATPLEFVQVASGATVRAAFARASVNTPGDRDVYKVVAQDSILSVILTSASGEPSDDMLAQVHDANGTLMSPVSPGVFEVTAGEAVYVSVSGLGEFVGSYSLEIANDMQHDTGAN